MGKNEQHIACFERRLEPPCSAKATRVELGRRLMFSAQDGENEGLPPFLQV